MVAVGRHQIRRLKFTDERVKLTNEMVQGMRVIKMYAWETAIGKKVHARRHATPVPPSPHVLSC